MELCCQKVNLKFLTPLLSSWRNFISLSSTKRVSNTLLFQRSGPWKFYSTKNFHGLNENWDYSIRKHA